MNEICVGTIQKENNQNEYKINIDSKQGILYSDGYIHDLSWLIPGESFVYTSGDGFLNIASITNSFEINKTNLLFRDKLCSDTIRQISIDDFSSRIAFGGYDKKLNIFNFDDGRSSISSNTDGKRSAQFEHTFLVTETGVEILTARKGTSRIKMMEYDELTFSKS